VRLTVAAALADGDRAEEGLAIGRSVLAAALRGELEVHSSDQLVELGIALFGAGAAGPAEQFTRDFGAALPSIVGARTLGHDPTRFVFLRELMDLPAHVDPALVTLLARCIRQRSEIVAALDAFMAEDKRQATKSLKALKRELVAHAPTLNRAFGQFVDDALGIKRPVTKSAGGGFNWGWFVGFFAILRLVSGLFREDPPAVNVDQLRDFQQEQALAQASPGMPPDANDAMFTRVSELCAGSSPAACDRATLLHAHFGQGHCPEAYAALQALAGDLDAGVPHPVFGAPSVPALDAMSRLVFDRCGAIRTEGSSP
jgi:hypothetical protein